MLRASILSAALALGACGGDAITVGPPPPAPAPAPTAAPTPPPTAPPVAAPEPEATTVAALTYRDEDFVEAETNRDPFRAYTSIFAPPPVHDDRPQRPVLMRETSVDEMRVIAIVSGVANPSAMLVGRDGTGHTVHRGDYLGRPEIVQTGGSETVPVTLNWRIDRIRPADIVLTREDPTAPNRPPLTRVLALHDAEEEGLEGGFATSEGG